MAELLRHYLYYTFHSLSRYDYMAIGWVVFLALLLMILGAFVRKKGLSYTLLFVGLILFFAGPPAIKAVMDGYLRAADVTVTSAKALHYSRAAEVEGRIKNIGKIDFSRCDLVLIFHAPAEGLWQKIASFSKPYAVRVEKIDSPLRPGQSVPFSILVEHYAKTPFDLPPIPRCYP